MSRLTRLHKEGLLVNEEGYYEPDKSNYMNITNKLGQLEDLEEELRCPIKVVFKALKEGIIVDDTGLINTAYSNEEFNKKYKTNNYYNLSIYYIGEWYLADLSSPYGDSECGEYGCLVTLKDYGKTWWLKGDI